MLIEAIVLLVLLVLLCILTRKVHLKYFNTSVNISPTGLSNYDFWLGLCIFHITFLYFCCCFFWAFKISWNHKSFVIVFSLEKSVPFTSICIYVNPGDNNIEAMQLVHNFNLLLKIYDEKKFGKWVSRKFHSVLFFPDIAS